MFALFEKGSSRLWFWCNYILLTFLFLPHYEYITDQLIIGADPLNWRKRSWVLLKSSLSAVSSLLLNKGLSKYFPGLFDVSVFSQAPTNALISSPPEYPCLAWLLQLFGCHSVTLFCPSAPVYSNLLRQTLKNLHNFRCPLTTFQRTWVFCVK